MTTSFAELGLNEQILAGVDALGFTTPTPVQEQAIPLVLAGRDLVASAQTGTGKTAAFALPVLQLVARHAAEAAAPSPDEASSPDGAQAPDAAPEDAAKGGPVVEATAAPADASPAMAPPNVQAASEAPGAAGAEQPQEPSPRKRRRRRRRGKGRQDAAAAPIQKPTPGYGPYALVITPTRELAQQIEHVASAVCEKTGQRAVIVMGGARFDRQARKLAAGCDLLVATPGRLIDLMDRKVVSLSQVEVVVLDEADRMLDMGFWPSVRRIMRALPQRRQTLLFSATIPPSIKGTVDAMLNDPATVEIARIGQTADTVEEHLCPVTQGQKTQLLQALLERDRPGRVLVFCRTKTRVDDVSAALGRAGIQADVMHSDRRQKDRERALERFRAGKVQVLVATDVMSRGIDVSGIDAVVNYDVPMDPEDYVHRIGRTGRAGATGHAYTFVAPDEITPLREIEYFTKRLVPVWDLEGFAYDEGRIVPNPGRATTKASRSVFSGSKGRRGFGGPSTGRFGRHF